MNSNPRWISRPNARRRTPLSNSTRKDHHRSTTELYSPRDAPTTHTTHHDATTSAMGAHDALQRVPAVPGDAAPNAPASNSLQHPRVRRGSHLDSSLLIARTITPTIASRSLYARTHSPAITLVPRTGSCAAICARRTQHLAQHDARAHSPRARCTHTRSLPVHAHTCTASSPPSCDHHRAGFIPNRINSRKGKMK